MCAHIPSQRPKLIGFQRREQESMQRRWQGWIISLLAHLLLVALVVGISHLEPDVTYERALGAGGAGPAGGGGGGQQGGGDGVERMQYVRTAPAASSAESVPVVDPIPVPPTLVPPKPVTPPKPTEIPTPTARPVPTTQVPPVASQAPSTSSEKGVGQGAGAGAGTSSGTGAGTGTGGGVGSGEGTGRGSGVGAGTGGGNATNYPPTPRQVFLPPLPAPAKVRGFRMTAWFDVDSIGKATLLRFTQSPDAGYNKKLRAVLLSMKFRPAVRPDGRPIRDTVDIEFVF